MWVWGMALMRKALFGLWCLVLLTFPVMAQEAQEPKELDWDPLEILGSKHDLTALNKRAGMEAMEGVAYVDYGDACVYCHIPPDGEASASDAEQIQGWNRIRPAVEGYTLYESPTFKSKAQVPNEITMLCLSCHDGSMAVDRIVNTPRAWTSGNVMTMHMKMNTNGDLNSCSTCHDGTIAHDISKKYIGTDMRRNHPVSIKYPGLATNMDFVRFSSGFNTPMDEKGFSNGVRLFDGFVECASCHDVHNPNSYKLLRTRGEFLCTTCHQN